MCIRDRTFFKPKYNIDFNGWHVEGDVFEWDYTITGPLYSSISSTAATPNHS